MDDNLGAYATARESERTYCDVRESPHSELSLEDAEQSTSRLVPFSDVNVGIDLARRSSRSVQGVALLCVVLVLLH